LQYAKWVKHDADPGKFWNLIHRSLNNGRQL
jgi:hypothetical protein